MDVYKAMLESLPLPVELVSQVWDKVHCNHPCECKNNRLLCCECAGENVPTTTRNYKAFCIECYDIVQAWGTPDNLVCGYGEHHVLADICYLES